MIYLPIKRCSITNSFTTHPGYEELQNAITDILRTTRNITSTKEYNEFLTKLVGVIKKNPIGTNSSKDFQDELEKVQQKKPMTESTIWGGVVMKKYDEAKNYVRKLLVIKQSGILGFEIHIKKLEKLKILDGIILVLYSNHNKTGYKKGIITVKLATKGDRFIFHPNDEHGMIAISDTIVEETSTNHLDDLVYIFKSSKI